MEPRKQKRREQEVKLKVWARGNREEQCIPGNSSALLGAQILSPGLGVFFFF